MNISNYFIWSKRIINSILPFKLTLWKVFSWSIIFYSFIFILNILVFNRSCSLFLRAWEGSTNGLNKIIWVNNSICMLQIYIFTLSEFKLDVTNILCWLPFRDVDWIFSLCSETFSRIGWETVNTFLPPKASSICCLFFFIINRSVFYLSSLYSSCTWGSSFLLY